MMFLSVPLQPLSCLPLLAHAACYYPNGSIAPNDTPCRDDTAESTCCGQGYACLSNGICQATGQELQKGGGTDLVRGACTDRSWRSSGCPLFFIDPETDNIAGGIGVARCQGTTEELYYCINSVQHRVNCTAKQDVLFYQRQSPLPQLLAILIDPAGIDSPTTVCDLYPDEAYIESATAVTTIGVIPTTAVASPSTSTKTTTTTTTQET